MAANSKGCQYLSLYECLCQLFDVELFDEVVELANLYYGLAGQHRIQESSINPAPHKYKPSFKINKIGKRQRIPIVNKVMNESQELQGLILYGMALQEIGEYPRAEQVLRLAVSKISYIDEDSQNCMTISNTHKYGRLSQLFQEQEIRYRLSKVLLSMGHPEQALSELDILPVNGKDPIMPKIQKMKIRLQQESKQVHLAQNGLEQLIKSYPFCLDSINRWRNIVGNKYELDFTKKETFRGFKVEIPNFLQTNYEKLNEFYTQYMFGELNICDKIGKELMDDEFLSHDIQFVTTFAQVLHYNGRLYDALNLLRRSRRKPQIDLIHQGCEFYARLCWLAHEHQTQYLNRTGGNSETANHYLNQYKRQHSSQESQELVTLVQHLHQNYPGSPEHFVVMGYKLLMQKSGDVNQLSLKFRDACPQSLEGKILLIDTYMSQGDYKSALDVCKKLVGTEHSRPEPLELLVECYRRSKQSEAALKTVDTYMRTFKHYPCAKLKYGFVISEFSNDKKSIKTAITIMEKYLKDNNKPPNVKVVLALSKLYEKRNKHHKAGENIALMMNTLRYVEDERIHLRLTELYEQSQMYGDESDSITSKDHARFHSVMADTICPPDIIAGSVSGNNRLDLKGAKGLSMVEIDLGCPLSVPIDYASSNCESLSDEEIGQAPSETSEQEWLSAMDPDTGTSHYDATFSHRSRYGGRTTLVRPSRTRMTSSGYEMF